MDREKNTVIQELQTIVDEICEKYCKYPVMYIGENPGDEVDMLEDVMYQEICANCPLMRI